jgi:hypothetical protein
MSTDVSTHISTIYSAIGTAELQTIRTAFNAAERTTNFKAKWTTN